jgi:hypothetical protein
MYNDAGTRLYHIFHCSVVSDSLRWRNVSVQQTEEEVEVVEWKEFRIESWRLWSFSSVRADSLAD